MIFVGMVCMSFIVVVIFGMDYNDVGAKGLTAAGGIAVYTQRKWIIKFLNKKVWSK